MLRFASETPDEFRRGLGWSSVVDALLDPAGCTVRCTPRRRTVMHDGRGGRVFRKLRRRRSRDARREWQTLSELRALGLSVPLRVCFGVRGADSVLCIAAVAGRPADLLIATGDHGGLLAAMAPVLRSLHGHGWAYRDMYWNHVFVDDGGRVSLVDVERAFRPRFGMHRWIVKDLAGLVSSVPDASNLSRTDGLRFLRRYLGGLDRGWKALARAVLAKAHRIRRHRPRYP